jgi:predicted transcriptional regulator
MKAGSLASNPNKSRLMEVLLKGEMNGDELLRKIRLPQKTVESLLSELLSEGFVTLSGNVYRITEDGKKALKSLKEDAGGKRR